MDTSPSDLPIGGDADGRALDQVRTALAADYEVVRPLGRGAMATVYLARDRALGIPVAVKVLGPEQAADETAGKRFEREARAAASLAEHPNAVAVTRFGRLPDGTPYLVMQYVKGRTMEERLEAEGRLPVPEATAVLAEVASALAAAHGNGIVHRDVRAGNVMWDEEKRRALLTDFGIAAVLDAGGPDAPRLTRTGELLGDVRHTSPEQLSGAPITELTDIYQFGLLGYELLAGRGPYEARSSAEWIRAHLQQEPRGLRELRPDVPEPLAALLQRCLAREPRHRPAAADVVRALERQGSPADVGRSGPTDERDLAKLLQRRVPQIVLIAAGAGMGLIQIVGSLDKVLPPQSQLLTVIFVAASVLASAVIAWFHGERGRQRAPALERVLLGLIGLAWVAATIVALVR
ncbi:MAG TPA: serine/threonine-protein kinase [Gemmatimonadota bacterium]|nr:serine/threonine-protein kinase [Gemmatimonadota bacterium]